MHVNGMLQTVKTSGDTEPQSNDVSVLTECQMRAQNKFITVPENPSTPFVLIISNQLFFYHILR